MQVLVIGGTRSLGPIAVRALAAKSHSVAVFHRGQHNGALPRNVRRIRSASAAMPVVRFPDSLKALQPDVVLHMIAMGEEDAEAAMSRLEGVARRIVVVSSGDVYRAYGVFTRVEAGDVEQEPLTEDSPLRKTLYPYRRHDTPPDALEYYHDKVLVEAVVNSSATLPATILRLPKLYGPQDNSILATVYGFRHQPQWRWTHGFVGNVAQGIARAVLAEEAAGRTYNVGEALTPTMGERLEQLPPNPGVPSSTLGANFEQHIAFDTSRIRSELGYSELVDERDAMRRQAAAAIGAHRN